LKQSFRVVFHREEVVPLDPAVVHQRQQGIREELGAAGGREQRQGRDPRQSLREQHGQEVRVEDGAGAVAHGMKAEAVELGGQRSQLAGKQVCPTREPFTQIRRGRPARAVLHAGPRQRAERLGRDLDGRIGGDVEDVARPDDVLTKDLEQIALPHEEDGVDAALQPPAMHLPRVAQRVGLSHEPAMRVEQHFQIRGRHRVIANRVDDVVEIGRRGSERAAF
jgi:hypothetical protein